MKDTKLETLMGELDNALKGNPVFILPNHKFAYSDVFHKDVIKTSPYFRQTTIPAGKNSVVDMCKALDQNDKVGFYNISVGSKVINIQVIITDELTLTALDLSNGDFEMAGLID